MVAKLQQQTDTSSTTTTYDSVVVGAGPYGLAAVTHLRKQGLNVKIFGRPFELWRNHMPKGMFLRSHGWASSISDPKQHYTFERFLQQSEQYGKVYPVPIEAYIEYGLWFQKQAVPDLDETYITSIERSGDEFVLILADKRIIKSRTVVMAIGLQYYAYSPFEYTHLAPELTSHTVDHNDFSRFAGKMLIIVGGGQCAMEYAALLYESGAQVHVVARRRIRWLDPDRSAGRTLWQQIKRPRAKIALGWKNLALELLPFFFFRFSQELKDRYIRNNYQASANDWLWDRISGKVTVHEAVQITEISEANDGVAVKLSDSTELKADHIMYATGYKVDLQKLPILAPSLLKQIEVNEGTPQLNAWFECSVPGLYFIGISSLRAFGPLYRFVFGNGPSAQRTAHAIAKKVHQVNKSR